MYNNYSDKKIYSPDNPQFKQKLYELHLIMEQCNYSKKNKVIDDAIIVLQNYQELNPTLIPLNMFMLELQGNIPIQYNNTIFSIFIHLRFQISHPEYQPFIFLKNIDTNKFDSNQLYKSAEIQNGLFITFNQFIPTSKNWNQNYKILDFMLEIQLALNKNFPFFLKINPNHLNQSLLQYNPNKTNQSYNQSLWQSQNQQQSQFYQQQPALNNQFKEQSQQIQLQDQNSNQKQNEEKGLADKFVQLSTSVFQFGREFFMTQKDKEERIINEVKSKVDIELLNQSKKLLESIKQQKQLNESLINTYQQQMRLIRDIKQKEEQINTNIHELDQQMTQMEQNIETYVTSLSQIEQHNFQELILADPLSNQIIDLICEIQAEKEGLYYMQKKFRYQNLDYDQLIKITRQISQQMFDQHLLLRKCVISQL